MEWYYVEAGQQAGPITDEELNALLAAGKIREDTLVWRAGMANWSPHGAVREAPAQPEFAGGGRVGLSAPVLAPARVACLECHQLVDTDDAIHYGHGWVCAGCKPLFLQKLREGAIDLATTAYGGFWIRGLAKLIDGVVQIICIVIPMTFFLVIYVRSGQGRNLNSPAMFVVMQFIYQGVALALGIAYNTLFLGKWGATPGKMMCGLKVVQGDKAPLTYLRSFGRAWAEYLNMFTMGVGYIMAAFDTEKRALHDHVCNTRVIKSR